MNHKQLVQQMNEMKAEMEALRSQVMAYENVETEIVTAPNINTSTSRRRMLKRMAIGAGAFAAAAAAGALSNGQQVLAESTSANAIDAQGGSGGYGITTSVASGGLAQLRLVPSSDTPFTGAGFPTTGAASRNVGEFYLSQDGNLFFMVASSGGNMTWRQLSGVNTAGSFHAITPTRLFDTRSNTGTVVSSSAGGTPTGAFGNSETRVYQVTSSGGPVPTGATAIVAAVTGVNIAMNAGQSGYFTFWGSGAKPTAAQVTYNVPGVPNAGSFTANLDAATGQLSIFTLRAADVILDIAGYYL